MRQNTTELFSEKSDDYAKYRPGYPIETLEKIVSSLDHFDQILAADVGAGTGISSRLLAEHGAKVLAIEPNRAMREAADFHPEITFVDGNAEDTTLENKSVNLVTSFQAFHWFDFKKSLREFNRILQPNGTLALVWSYWDEEDPFTLDYMNLISDATRHNPHSVSPYDGFPHGLIKKIRIKILWKFRQLPYFTNVERHRYHYSQSLNFEALIGSARSQSYILHQGPVWDNLCREIEALYNRWEQDSKLKYKVNLFLAKPKK